MVTHSVVSVQQGRDVVGWAVLTDIPGQTLPSVSQLFRTEAEAVAERDRLIALEEENATSPDAP